MFPVIADLKHPSRAAIVLSPTQRKAADEILLALQRDHCAVLQDHGSNGKSTVLDHIHDALGGSRVGAREFLSALSARDPAGIEEAFLDLMDAHMDAHDLVILDDLHLIKEVVEGYDYPRQRLFDVVMTALLAKMSVAGKKLVFATSEVPAALARRGHRIALSDLDAKDFGVIIAAYLDSDVRARLDFEEIHRFAPALSAHQLRKAAVWLSHESNVDTAAFCEYLSAHDLVSNVETDDVEAVTWDDLKGVEDVVRELEAKIALPFEHRELAAELNLKPKRGVLLAGPPGTGKTTIGRALAHRLKGRFFLVDGTMIAGSGRFYDEIDRVFRAAERNAPSVVFIDDADVIFGGDKESGLYRYLLTKLDGLESAGAGRICVMMTAMEPSDLPAAILRSGRIELWLDTRLPSESARADIFRDRLASVPAPLCNVDVEALASASRGCTGADLKSAVEDGKLRFAHNQVMGKPHPPLEAYFIEAITAIRGNRRKYRKRRPVSLGEPQTFGFQA